MLSSAVEKASPPKNTRFNGSSSSSVCPEPEQHTAIIYKLIFWSDLNPLEKILFVVLWAVLYVHFDQALASLYLKFRYRNIVAQYWGCRWIFLERMETVRKWWDQGCQMRFFKWSLWKSERGTFYLIMGYIFSAWNRGLNKETDEIKRLYWRQNSESLFL